MKLTLLLLTLVTTFSASTPDFGTLLACIAEVETGATNTTNQQRADLLRGRDGEVSRYQIMPSVWAANSGPSDQPTNPLHARRVAGRILLVRISHFRQTNYRQPTPMEIYILWNKPAMAYSGKWRGSVVEKARNYSRLVNNFND